MIKLDKIQNIVHCVSISKHTKNIEILITDHLNQLIIDKKLYKSNAYFSVSEVIETVNNMQSAYNIAFSKSALQKEYNIYQTDILIDSSIRLVKYDLIQNQELFRHESVISGIKIFGDQVIFSINSMFKPLNFAKTYSPLCRAEFCDESCALNLEDHVLEVEIITLISKNIIQINQEVKDFDLMESYGFPPIFLEKIEKDKLYLQGTDHILEAGQSVLLKRICDKKINTCASRYNNAVNFRAEPHINDTISFVLE